MADNGKASRLRKRPYKSQGRHHCKAFAHCSGVSSLRIGQHTASNTQLVDVFRHELALVRKQNVQNWYQCQI